YVSCTRSSASSRDPHNAHAARKSRSMWSLACCGSSRIRSADDTTRLRVACSTSLPTREPSARLGRRGREGREQGQRRRRPRPRLRAVEHKHLPARAGNGQSIPVELDYADVRVVERLATFHPLHDAVLLPELFEDRRSLDEVGNERLDARPGVASPVPDAERRDEARPAPPACVEEVVDLGVEEDETRHVPLCGGPPLETGEQGRCGRI